MPNKLHGYAQRLPVEFTDDPKSLRRAMTSLISTLQRALNHAADTEDRISAVLPQITQGKIDKTLSQNGNVPLTTSADLTTPASSQFTISQAGGVTTINITLPQNVIRPTVSLIKAALLSDGQNIQLAPIMHRLRSATDASFSVAANLKTYGPSTQVTWQLNDTNTLWELSSSFDGVSFNDWTSPQSA